ncbi:putative DNA-binding domain-containing protein [Pseudomonas sp. TH39(2020)]|uniref:HvfC/BufC N-terminal domain-containing protein n=1 Tax=Pseudomonas sp. TH39(2020) TaxID=2796349 RepID=UPI001911D492|nr:DNA-binding domain-containing protein [Pseudomonas sp. TH39(2020)]MBK5398447.1 putative DNA-binding domain-containing protein [Pseudomonas sp. TH39(2020)]
MRLNDWQLAFEDYLSGERAIADPKLGASLIGSPTLDVNTGLAIYHNAYQARLQEVLRGDYPVIWHWLGDDEFAQLAVAYIRQSPSAHFSLRWLGRGFEMFLRQHLVPEQSAALAELAAFEWAFTLAFDAPESRPLTMQDMAALPPQDWPMLRVCPGTTVQWLECTFNSVALWRAVKDETAFPGSTALEAHQVVVIWRSELVCHYRSLESAEATALKGMFQLGWSFAELCSELAVIFGESAPLQAVTWLKQWIHDGWLERCDS